MISFPLVTVASRAVAGLALGVILGILALFLGWSAVPASSRASYVLVVFSVGLGASVASFMAWLASDVGKRALLVCLMAALGGGVVGAWTGFLCGSLVYSGNVGNALNSLDTSPTIAVLTGAVLSANLLSGGWYLYRLWRYREM